MNITKKIIITDTNIITDLSNANILKKFVNLDNVYISDLVKSDEINYNTGNTKIINNFKVITSTAEQLLEISTLSKIAKKLSTYDILNFIIARDNDCILATGDNRLKNFSERNNVEVIRTLKIISFMKEKDIISTEEAITACELLRKNQKTRIPEDDLIDKIKEFQKDLVTC